MQSSAQPSGHRLRFTLRVLFVAVAGVALVVSWINTYRVAQRNRLLETEIRRLRDDFGELSIEDESRFHAIGVATNNKLEWAWRIWIPEGHSYRVRSFGGKISKEGFPQGGNTITISEPGEHEVRYRVRRDPRNNVWWGEIEANYSILGGYEQPWVEWKTTASTTGGVSTTTQDFAPEECVELARHRVSQARSSDKIEDPAAGFLIWLEPN